MVCTKYFTSATMPDPLPQGKGKPSTSISGVKDEGSGRTTGCIIPGSEHSITGVKSSEQCRSLGTITGKK